MASVRLLARAFRRSRQIGFSSGSGFRFVPPSDVLEQPRASGKQFSCHHKVGGCAEVDRRSHQRQTAVRQLGEQAVVCRYRRRRGGVCVRIPVQSERPIRFKMNARSLPMGRGCD